jgi:hypothetical protein
MFIVITPIDEQKGVLVVPGASAISVRSCSPNVKRAEAARELVLLRCHFRP